MVFQNYALFSHMTVADNVGFPSHMRKLPRPERDARVDKALWKDPKYLDKRLETASPRRIG